MCWAAFIADNVHATSSNIIQLEYFICILEVRPYCLQFDRLGPTYTLYMQKFHFYKLTVAG